MDRDCANCIWHDLVCKSWNCDFINRQEAKDAVEAMRKRRKQNEETGVEDRNGD